MNKDLEQVFNIIYDTNYWFMNQTETRSGLGSTILFTENISKEILTVIEKYQIKSLLDVSCGEWNWMRHVKSKFPANFKYTGLDIVENIVNINTTKFSDENTQFVHSDMLSYMKSLPSKSVDLILCRHTLEHLPEEYTFECINEMKRVSNYSLITTHRTIGHNRNINYTENTYRPVNLELAPYSDVLGKFLIEHIYDGPLDPCAPEMFIILYSWSKE